MSYQLRITRGDNGYRLDWEDEAINDDPLGEGEMIRHEEYIQDDEGDELRSIEELLWWITDHFGRGGSKHDPERLRIVRELPDGTYKDG